MINGTRAATPPQDQHRLAEARPLLIRATRRAV
jgi:hypothetical protein